MSDKNRRRSSAEPSVALGPEPIRATDPDDEPIPAYAERTIPKQFGRYRVIDLLGRGAMGEVYLAEDTQLGRRVALKVPVFGPRDGPSVVDRFKQEARLAAQLQHPNICPIYDFDEIDGVKFLSMAYIEGTTLAHAIDGDDRLSFRQTAMLCRKMALAMEEAHRNGVIHRDLKPANVILNAKGDPIIMDFGLARVSRETAGAARLTASGIMLGTPAYMAPEQMSGQADQIGPCSDIYSLGAVLYEMLTGKLPYSAPNLLALMSKVATTDPPAPRSLRGDVPEALERICLKAMARSIPDRYPTMAALAADLTDWLRGKDIVRTVTPEVEVVVDEAPPALKRTVRQQSSIRTTAAIRRKSNKATTRMSPRDETASLWRWVLLGVLLLVVAIVGSRWYQLHRESAAPLPTPETTQDPNAADTATVAKAETRPDVSPPPEGDAPPVRASDSADASGAWRCEPGILAMASSRAGNAIVTSHKDGSLRMWDPMSGTVIQRWDSGVAQPRAVSVAPYGGFAAVGGGDGKVNLWMLSAHPPKLKNTSDSFNNSAVKSVHVSSGATWYCAADATGHITFWHFDGTQLGDGPMHVGAGAGVNCLDHFLADNRDELATGSCDGYVALWKLAPGRADLIHSWIELGNPVVSALAYTPDGGGLLVGRADGKLSLWNLGAKREASDLAEHHTSPVTAVAFAQDQSRMASADAAGTILLFDLGGKRLLKKLAPGRAAIVGMAFVTTGSPKQPVLLAADANGRLHRHRAHDGSRLDE